VPDSPPTPPVVSLTAGQRWLVLAAAFLAWAFAGLGNALYVLISRDLVVSLLGAGVEERVVTHWFAWFQAAFLFGAAAGGWLFGLVGDRAGRARSLGLAVLCYSGFSLAAAFAASLEQHLALRFLACLGFGGTWPGAVALVSEAWPDASRPVLAGLLGAAANFGFVFLGALAYAYPVTPDAFRWTLFVAGSPALLGLLVLAAVPESPRWRAAASAGAGAAPLGEVFRPPLLRLTLLGIGLGAVPVVGTAANANWIVPWTAEVTQKKSQGDPRQKAVTLMTRSSGGIVGSLFGGVIASAVGRRLTYFLISLGAFALSNALFGLLDPSAGVWFQAVAFLLGVVGVAYFGWLPLFLPELFPTRVRATGAGVSFNTGRVVAGAVVLAVPALGGLLAGNYAMIGLWSGLIYVVGMGLIWLAPARPVARPGE
jgi:MFS family permease